MEIKNVGTSEQNVKAWNVVQGEKDKEKATLIQNSPTIREHSVRPVQFSHGMKGYRIWTQDVAQAFIQSQNLTSYLFIRPLKIFGLESSKVLKLPNPLYGLPDASVYWDEEFSSILTNSEDKDLGM